VDEPPYIAFFATLLSAMTTSAVLAADQATFAPPPPATATVPVSLTTSAIGAKRPHVDRDDQLICETVQEIGARLGDHKICLTRAEWRHQSNVRGGMQTMVVGGCKSDVPINSKC
jgi:hypothetical protein